MTKITQVCIAFILMFSINGYSSNANSTSTSNAINQIKASQSNPIQRVRIDIVTPMGYVRHLLLGFTDNIATDGFDYGYDALNPDNFPDDCNWIINGGRYVIQGVGAFNETKKYPLGLFLTNSGSVGMSLNSLENFDAPIDVFIHDALLNTYTKINDVSFTADMASGVYLDRFFIAFMDENARSLSTIDNDLKETVVNYLSNTKELYLKTNNDTAIKHIQIYNILGKELFSIKNLNKSEIRIPVENLGTNYGIVSVTTELGIISKKVMLH